MDSVEVQTNTVITKNSITNASTFTFPVQESGLKYVIELD
jgi:hypothetical protein